ncbi:MAG: NADAR family protein [Clostridiales bacterium]|nr:NADAR family protein [Clostridiales bacterium]
MADAIDSFKGQYSFLSNFYEFPVKYEGLIYTNAEAAFQSAKLLDSEERKQFCALSPAVAKRLGRKVNLRPDWETVKVGIMEEILFSKFTDCEDLKEKLLATEDAELIEGNTWNDRFWGVCKGTGKNMLGKTLMKVRDRIRQAG